jgi:hypothetical protein
LRARICVLSDLMDMANRSLMKEKVGAEIAYEKPSDRVRRAFARAWSRAPLRSIPGTHNGVPDAVLRS